MLWWDLYGTVQELAFALVRFSIIFRVIGFRILEVRMSKMQYWTKLQLIHLLKEPTVVRSTRAIYLELQVEMELRIPSLTSILGLLLTWCLLYSQWNVCYSLESHRCSLPE